MTDETIPIDEFDPRDDQKKSEWTEEISVAGSRLIETVQELLREAVVRKISIRDKEGRTLMDIPLYAGVLGVAVLGYWSVLALIAAWFTEVSILIVRDEEAAQAQTGEPTAVGEMASKAGTAVSDAVYRASKSASDALSRAADAVERSMTPAYSNGKPAGEKEAKAAAEAEPQRCQAITKAGTQCKRNAIEGSVFCSIHQPG